jgi:hypothetical protein
VDHGSSDDDLRAHPVLFKLTTLKQTLDGLAPLDDKLEKALKKSSGKSKKKKLSLDDYEIEKEGESDLDDG